MARSAQQPPDIERLVVVSNFELFLYTNVGDMVSLLEVEVGVRMLNPISVLPYMEAKKDKLLGGLIGPDFARPARSNRAKVYRLEVSPSAG